VRIFLIFNVPIKFATWNPVRWRLACYQESQYSIYIYNRLWVTVADISGRDKTVKHGIKGK